LTKKRLQIEQLETKLSGFKTAQKVVAPPSGWLKAVRVSLGMALQQLADKLSIAKQSVQEIELKEPLHLKAYVKPPMPWTCNWFTVLCLKTEA